MSLRFCEKCSAEVEDVGGFCLLGHPLRLEPPIPSVAEVRQEVDRVLDEVADESYVRLDDALVGGSGSDDPPAPPPARTRRPSLWDSLGRGSGDKAQDPIEAFAPPPRMDWGPQERSNLLQRTIRRRQGVAPVSEGGA